MVDGLNVEMRVYQSREKQRPAMEGWLRASKGFRGEHELDFQPSPPCFKLIEL